MSGARDPGRARITDSGASTAQVSPPGPPPPDSGRVAPGGFGAGWPQGADRFDPVCEAGQLGEDFSPRPGDPQGRAPGPEGCRSMAGLTPWGLRLRRPARCQATCSLSGQDRSKQGLGTRGTEDK